MSTADPQNKPRHGPEWAYLMLMIVAFYPVSIVIGAYAVIEPLDPIVIARAAAVTFGVVFLLYFCLRAVILNRETRAQWLGVVLVLAFSYQIAANTLVLFGVKAAASDPRVAVMYMVATMAVATAVARPWRASRNDLRPITIVACLLVAMNAYRAVSREEAEPPPTWLSAADALTYAPLRDQRAVVAPARDIYYIILDAMGRADTLQRIYGLDMDPFEADLKAQGFHVVDQARSNYAHTVLSFPSFLNLAYLDSVANAVGAKSGNRDALEFLIQHNALMRLAKQAGYQVVAMGTDYAATKTFDEADVCVCQQYGLSMFEQTVLAATPLAAAPLDPWTYGAHRAKILASLDALDAGMPSSQRQFVFAHILAPHPPFTFTPDGGFHRPGRPFSINDGSDYLGSRDEYVQGYHDQAAYVVKRVASIVHAILSRPGPRPVIVIHGDHGPGSRLQSNDAAGTDMTERTTIFEAYYFPDRPDLANDSITPVNLVRALSNQYFGTDLPRLPDLTFFSTTGHPYDFLKVWPEGPGGSASER
jgi:hypothetical protein